ncbi:MAG: STN and carboxypeptidase regulatory-like domain-containing protein [Bacteroidota bacterium]
MRKSKIWFIFAMLTVLGTTSYSQPSYLSRKISIDLPFCSIEVALMEIGKAAGFRFSYDADLIPGNKKVTLIAKNTPVSRLLREILGRDIRSREVGNHIILVRTRAESKEVQPYPDIMVSGTIMNGSDRTPLMDATVYEIENKRSSISAKNGTYKLIIPSGGKKRSLSFSKNGYTDTVIFIKQSASQRIDLLLRPLNIELPRINTLPGLIRISRTDSMKLVLWLVPRESMVNAQNLEVRTSSTFQASIIPYIGTNWNVTGSITNRFSLNLLAGYTGGLKGIEIGGLLNVTRNQISGVQFGGLGNIVGGPSKGWQIGGAFNFDLGKFEGVQIGGLFNYVPDTIIGVQIGGLANIITGQIKGIQFGGLANIVTHNSDGWQIAGLMNLTLMDVKKIQIGGLINYGRNMDGLQIAGVLNFVRRNNSGVQIAGLVNYATIVYGLQLGLINIANTVERGVPIGLFSYVQEGYHLFELSGNEIFYGNVGFKSGTRTFYNFVQFGMGSDYKLQGSYGIGTIFTLKKKLSMNIDASAGLVYHPTDTIYHGFLLKFNPALEYRFSKHFAIFGGPAYNFFLFSKGKPSATPRGLSTYDFYFKSTENASIQMWIGGVVGIRL